MPEREELLAIRNLLAERHEEFREILRQKTLRGAMGELQGEQRSRVPKGFAKDHPAEDLVRRRQWFLESTLDGGVMTSGRMLPEIINRFRAATPMLELLNQPFVQERKPKKLPLWLSESLL